MADTDWAFAQYEAVRGRLPAMPPRRASTRVADLGTLTARFDVFLLDAYGVLNFGNTPIKGAPARVAALQNAGKKVMVLTNGASFPAAESLKKYRRFGYDFAPEDVISSRDILAADLASFPPMRWGAMAHEGSALDLLGAGISLLDDTQASYDTAEGFLLIGSQNWTEARQDKLVQSLSAHPRPVLVGNPDLVAPYENGLNINPGYYAHMLARDTGVEPRFSGKPFGAVFEAAKQRYGDISPERVLMVGDTLHTDILGGAAAGVKTLLIENHGLFKGHDVRPYIAQSGIVPDFIAPTI